MERVSDINITDVLDLRTLDINSPDTQKVTPKTKQKSAQHKNTISSLIALNESSELLKPEPKEVTKKIPVIESKSNIIDIRTASPESIEPRKVPEKTADVEVKHESSVANTSSIAAEVIAPQTNHDKDSFSSLETIFEKALQELKKTTSEKIFNTWFNNIKLISIEPTLVDQTQCLIMSLGCQNKFTQEHLKHQYSDQIQKSFERVTESKVSVKFEVVKDLPKASQSFAHETSSVLKTISQKKTKAEVVQLKSDETNLNFNYNFSNFVIGNCNQFAHAACLKVSENPGCAYNPLLIYGGVGLGKTHLANAIGNAARRRNKKVLLASSEKFVTELISSLKNNNMDKFKARFRSLDVLIIDDIQFIIGKERTQEEFFHTFNELYGKNKQIIITSDKLPQDLVGLEERLRTRFSSGLSVDLQAPDFETRIAILIKKAETYNLNLSYNVARIIAERIDTNVRELEGALTRLQALCSLFNQEPSEDLAKKVVDTISPIKLKEITTDNIKEVVAKQFNVSINDLSGKRRTQNIAMARQVAMYLCRKHTARSFPEIGAIFGGRDHSTVIHAIKTVSDRLLADTILNDSIDNIISLLERK